jgi:REP element-mobilizing transposase RayT
MARKPRIYYPGALYHVILQGSGAQEVFVQNGECQPLEALIAEGTERFRYRVHAYCWMTNHLHFAVQITNVPLSDPLLDNRSR